MESLKIKIEDIIIKKSFAKTTPHQEKMDAAREYYKKHGHIEKPVLLSKNNVLLDNYVQFLVAKEANETEISYVKTGVSYRKIPTTYVFGHHLSDNSKREYVWRMPQKWYNVNIEPGSTVLADTKYGVLPIVVNRCERLEKPPVKTKVKRIVAFQNKEEQECLMQ